MNGKSPDFVGVLTGVGKHDFHPVGPVIHGIPGGPKRRNPDSEAQYVSEKIAEGAMTQQELARVRRERDALARALAIIEAGDLPDGKLACPNAQQFAAETLAKLAGGELRKA